MFNQTLNRKQASILAILVSTLSGTSIMFTPYIGDEIWAIYLHGTQYLNDPFSIFVRPIKEIPLWLNSGNFRPLGRFFEHLGYFLPMLLTSITNITPEVWYAVNRLVLWIIFHLSIFFFCMQLFKSYFGKVENIALLSVIISNSISLINNQAGGLRLFPMFYNISVIILIASLYLILIRTKFKYNTKKWNLIKIFIGILAATYNELTNIIIPLSLVLIYLTNEAPNLNNKIRKSLQDFSHIVIPFLLIWAPIRIIISGKCNLYECYEPSSVSAVGLTDGTVLSRLTSAIPPIPQITSERWLGDVHLSSAQKISTLLICIVMLLQLIYILRKLSNHMIYIPEISVKISLVLGILGLLITSMLLSMSLELQKNKFMGVSWRETPIYIFFISIILLASITSTMGKIKRRKILNKAFIFLSISLIVVTNFLTFTQNAKFTNLYNQHPVVGISKSIEYELVNLNSELSGQICFKIFNDQYFSRDVSLALVQGINQYSMFKTGRELC